MPSSENLAIIKTCPLLSQLPKDAIERLARASIVRLFEPEHEITVDGEPGVAAFVIASGAAMATREGSSLSVEMLGPGAIFGDTFSNSPTRPAATVRSILPVTCLAIPRWHLRAELTAAEAAAAVRLQPMPNSEPRVTVTRPTS